MAAVARRLSIPYPPVVTVLRRHRLVGDRIFEKPGPKRKPRTIGSVEVEQLLLSDEYLTRWATLTMRARAQKVYDVFNVRVNYQTLRLFYRRNDIRYRRTYDCFRAETLDPAGL